MVAYTEFLERKSQLSGDFGFEPLWMPDWLFDFQKHLVEWACRKGRAGIFADCGLGKTPMELVWAENVARKTNGRVLILTPLAVSHQTVREGNKFGVEVHRSVAGELPGKIITTNYQRLHHFNPADFSGVVCGESSILKNFDGATKTAVTEFLRTIRFRLLETATAAPNDYIELGTSSEALGYLGYKDMLSQFFKSDNRTDHIAWNKLKFRFRGHAEQPFWRWVCSWARACRKPSDLGFQDGDFILPPLTEHEHFASSKARDGMLFPLPAVSMREELEERRITIDDRCEAAADIALAHDGASVLWCHLNPEGDLLERLIPDAVQVSGSMPDEKKEEHLLAFQSGEVKRLITKQKIGCFGLNWQHCHNVITFPSHSWEQYYQAVRRCWRFGQKHPVNVHIVTTEGEADVLRNLQSKARAADAMFESLCYHMNDAMKIDRTFEFETKERVPAWL